MAGYTYLTLGQLWDTLDGRLYGQGFQFWSKAELTSYIQEALRTWNSLTSFWRGEFVFPTIQGNVWYDLTTQVGSLRPLTVTDSVLLSQIEYHLLEPQSGAYPLVWAGSRQFGLDDILGALTRRRDEVLSEAGCQITQSLVPTVPGRTFLSDSTIDIRRVVWFPVSGSGYVPVVLRPSDVWAKQSFSALWTISPGSYPGTYLQSTQPPLSFDVDNPPPVVGRYEVLSVRSGAQFGTTTSSLLGLPDDWSWLAKWGALADLLSRESNSKDSPRAKYCEQRYQEGLKFLGVTPALLWLRVNNVPLFVDSVRNGDDFNPSWEGQAQGPPQTAYVAGLNLIGLSPPDSVGYSLTAGVVRNAPLPSGVDDLVQLAHEDLEAVVDYVQHLAAFKMGGEEFLATIPLYQRFLAQAGLYNSKLAELGQFQKPIYDLSQLEEERSPRLSPSGAGV